MFRTHWTFVDIFSFSRELIKICGIIVSSLLYRREYLRNYIIHVIYVKFIFLRRYLKVLCILELLDILWNYAFVLVDKNL